MNDDALFQAFSNPNCNRASKARFMVKYYTAAGCLKPRAQTYPAAHLFAVLGLSSRPPGAGERELRRRSRKQNTLSPRPPRPELPGPPKPPALVSALSLPSSPSSAARRRQPRRRRRCCPVTSPRTRPFTSTTSTRRSRKKVPLSRASRRRIPHKTLSSRSGYLLVAASL